LRGAGDVVFEPGTRPGPGWLDPVSNGIIADDVLLAFIYL
jgi:hypothetical protein